MKRSIVVLVLAVLCAAAWAAVDSSDKRGSVLNMTGSVLPGPDSSIDAGDRAQLVGVYRGLEDDVPEAVSGQRGLSLKLELEL